MTPCSVDNPSSRPRVRAAGGFTLIELMITVAVIGILAAIALPSYQDSVRKGRRADAQAFMSEVVARQQHYLLDRRAFAVSLTGAAADNGLAMTVPDSVSRFYDITVDTNNAARPPSFTVTGVPKGAQAVDTCAKLVIDQRGVKSASGTGTCW